jgi:prepilin-type N-terminal cleavage/methylation domain-containing protein
MRYNLAMQRRKFPLTGFTLIELMIVVAIIGILAAIAIPRFASLIAKSRESTTKGNLGSIRSALAVYYSDNEGVYPVDSLSSMASKYLPIVPPAVYPRTNYSPGHVGAYTGVKTGAVDSGGDDIADNVSGWMYDNGSSDTWFGRVIANCSHEDARGFPWSSF